MASRAFSVTAATYWRPNKLNAGFTVWTRPITISAATTAAASMPMPVSRTAAARCFRRGHVPPAITLRTLHDRRYPRAACPTHVDALTIAVSGSDIRARCLSCRRMKSAKPDRPRYAGNCAFTTGLTAGHSCAGPNRRAGRDAPRARA